MTVKQNIQKLLNTYTELSVNKIAIKLNVPKQMVHVVIKQLIANKLVTKLGAPPKTIYRKAPDANSCKPKLPIYNLSEDELTFLTQNFLIVTDVGSLLGGIEAFSYWCTQRNLPVEKTVKEFIITKKNMQPIIVNLI